MALSPEWQARLDAASEGPEPDARVVVTRRLAEQMLEALQGNQRAMEWLRGRLEADRSYVVRASEVWNLLTGEYFDASKPSVLERPVFPPGQAALTEGGSAAAG